MTAIKNTEWILIDAAQDTLNIFLEDLLSERGIQDKTISQLEYELEKLNETLNVTEDDTYAHTIAQLIELIELALQKYNNDSIIEKRIRSHGNSAAIFIPQHYRGQFARIIIIE
jgi:putative transposon-encoded protein